MNVGLRLLRNDLLQGAVDLGPTVGITQPFDGGNVHCFPIAGTVHDAYRRRSVIEFPDGQPVASQERLCGRGKRPLYSLMLGASSRLQRNSLIHRSGMVYQYGNAGRCTGF
jgi:hypothetical protein